MTRSVTTVLLWLVATIALTASLGATWTAANVQSQSGYVDLMSELGNDPELQRAVAESAGQQMAQQAPAVAPGLGDSIAELVTNAMLRVANSENFDAAWRETSRRSHQSLFDGPTPTTIQLDIAPLVEVALDELTSSLPFTLPSPDHLYVTVSDHDPTDFVEAASHASTAAVVAGGVALIAALLALAVTRRRSTTFAALGVGVMLSAGFWYVAGHVGVPELISRSTAATDAEKVLGQQFSDRIVESLDSTLLWVAAAGAAMVLVGVVSRAVRR